MPKANAGYLPTIAAQGSIGIARSRANEIIPDSSGSGFTSTGTANFISKPRGYGLSVDETVFNGNQTLNSIRQAESQVFGAREQLRNTEQNTLLSGSHRLHGRAGGHGHPRPRQQQRRCVERAAARDARPLHRRRSDAHRRGASGGEPVSGPGHRAQRCGDLAGRGGALPSIHRRPADQPCAGEAAREADTENVARGDIDLASRASVDQRVPAWRRRGAIAGEDRGGRALSDVSGSPPRSPISTT